jgi:hypothetical protein
MLKVPIMSKRLEFFTAELWSIVTHQFHGYALFTEYVFEEVNHSTACALFTNLANEEELGIIVCNNQMFCSFKLKQICGNCLPWFFRDLMSL